MKLICHNECFPDLKADFILANPAADLKGSLLPMARFPAFTRSV